MFNDEFDVVDMNNYDDEIGKDEVPDLESNNPPTSIIGRKNPASSQSSRVNNVRDDEIDHLTSHNPHATAKVIATKVYDRCEFNDHFNQIRDLVPKAAETLEHIGFHTWSRALCPGNRYNIMTSNIVESVNAMFDVEREFPMVALFDEIMISPQIGLI
ncbi:hypothetical protein KY284_037630 [Solanum tuberosum]|nr:hypothetical protein KY284_037630 [Solanum tuberosum]